MVKYVSYHCTNLYKLCLGLRLLVAAPGHAQGVQPGPDLHIGYIGLTLGTQDPRGPSTNCGTRRVNGRYMIIQIKLRQKCMSSMNLNMTVG